MDKRASSATVEKLAREFSRILSTWLGADKLREVVKRNDDDVMNPEVCHSHDFCDANEAMDRAARKMKIKIDAGSEWDADLWNRSWDMAKKNHFYIGPSPLQEDLIAFVKKFYIDYEPVRDVNDETEVMVQRARALLIRAGVEEAEIDPEAHAIELERQGNEIAEQQERDAEERE